MLYLIAYDIASPRRLRRVCRFALNTGARLQKSLFCWDLSAADFALRWADLAKLINPAEDAIAAYPICRNCADQARRLGRAPELIPPLIYIY